MEKMNKTEFEKLIKEPSVSFNNYDHSYVRKSDGKPYVSCSQVASMLPKDYLVAWASKENYEYMQKNWDINRTYTQWEKENLLKEARWAYKNKQIEATTLGTKIHKWIELHIAGKNPPIEPDSERAIKMFLDWEKENIKEWLAIEMMVSSDTMEVAGRMDAVALLTGDISAIVDFKTSNTIYDSYAISTAGYWECLREMGFGVDQRLILRLPKTEIHKVWDDKNRTYNIEENLLESRTIMSGIREDLATFKHLREIHRWQENMKN